MTTAAAAAATIRCSCSHCASNKLMSLTHASFEYLTVTQILEKKTANYSELSTFIVFTVVLLRTLRNVIITFTCTVRISELTLRYMALEKEYVHFWLRHVNCELLFWYSIVLLYQCKAHLIVIKVKKTVLLLIVRDRSFPQTNYVNPVWQFLKFGSSLRQITAPR